MMSPSAMRCAEAARFRPVPAVMRQYSKVRPRRTSSWRSRSTSSALVAPGAAGGEGGEHGIDHPLGRLPQQGQLGRALAGAQPLQRVADVHQRAIGQPVAQHGGGVGGQEGGLDPDPAQRHAQRPRRWASAFSDGVGGGAGDRAHRRRPEPAELVLVLLQPVGDVGGEVRPAPDVDHHGQVAAEADGVAVVEEGEGVAAQHVLRGLPGGGDHRVHVRLRQQRVQARGVEGRHAWDDALVPGLGAAAPGARFCGLVMTVMASLPGCLAIAAALRRTWR